MLSLKFEVFSMSSTAKKQRHYDDRTIKILYGTAVARCTKCKTNLLLRDVAGNVQQIGEIAHIYPFGEKNAPRYNEIVIDGFPENKKNDISNLILLCPNCHKEIDKLSESFPAKLLIQMKQKHEEWANECLSREMSNISYAELDIICKAIANCVTDFSDAPDYSTIKIEDKIRKNNLSSKCYNLIQQGMLKTKFVHEYLNNQINVMFTDDLLKCIKSIYRETSQKYSGDELFMAMLTKMHAGIERDFSKQAAGIAVLTYFFHVCEIFEK